MILLSILIPTTPDRKSFMDTLLSNLVKQRNDFCAQTRMEIIQYEDNFEHSIGYKRNWLLERANGKYLAFFDSDDRPGSRYVQHAFEGIYKDVDCCGLTGIITEDDKNPKKFIHSIEYDSWFEKDNIYYRNTNHLNVTRSSIAKQMKFPEINLGEDHSYSKQLLASGLLKTEYWDRNEIIYYYDYRSKK